MVFSSRVDTREMLSLELNLIKFREKLNTMFQNDRVKALLGNNIVGFDYKDIMVKIDEICSKEETPGEDKDLLNNLFHVVEFINKYGPRYENMVKEFNYNNDLTARRLHSRTIEK